MKRTPKRQSRSLNCTAHPPAIPRHASVRPAARWKCEATMYTHDTMSSSWAQICALGHNGNNEAPR
eukprot:6150313-Pyramimonas_sp.AAC.1